MKGFVSKRSLIILASCLLLIGIMVPVATFAKGTPPGEQKRHAHPTVTHSAQGTTVTVTTDCSSVPLQLLTTLQVGDTLTGSASLTSTDSNEQSEGETLVLQEQNSSFTKTILTLDVATGSATIPPLTATVANDNINACINGIDSDETGTVTFNVTHANQRQLFILMQGINTSLDAGQISANKKPSFDQPDGIAVSLRKQFPHADILSYSYNGVNSQGQLQPYDCDVTFKQHLKDDVTKLNDEIIGYLNQPGHQNTNIYLVGHSLGGVVAFGYLTFLAAHNWTIPNIPSNGTGSKIASVITLDSPIGGITNDKAYLNDVKAFALAFCLPITVPDLSHLEAVSDLVKIFNSAANTHPQGGMAEITTVLSFGESAMTNQALADQAIAHSIPVLTIGNLKDFLWDPGDCSKLGVHDNFESTQWLTDEAPKSAVYGRDFTGGDKCTVGVVVLGELNHLKVLTNSLVQMGIMQFLPAGAIPDKLAVAPPNP